MKSRRGWCYKCVKRRAKIIEHDDGALEPTLCSNCKWNHERSVNRWLTKEPRTAEVDGIEVKGFTTDKKWNERHVPLSDFLIDRKSYEQWLEDQDADV